MIIHQERLKEHITRGNFLRLPDAAKAAYLYCLAYMDDDSLVDTEFVRRLATAGDAAVSALFEAEFLSDYDGIDCARVIACPFLRGGDGDVS